MRKNYIVATALATVCSGALLTAQAQSTSPATQPQPQSQAQTQARDASQPTTTLTGCVYKEQDVPGRAPNVAERAGVLEDYILAEVSPATPEGTPGTPGATGTSGVAAASKSMYKLEFVDDERLQALVGKRVEVTGRVDRESGDSTGGAATAPKTSDTDKVMGRDRIDLAEFEVVSIREVSGTCPPKPTKQ